MPGLLIHKHSLPAAFVASVSNYFHSQNSQTTMMRKESKRVCFTPDDINEKPTVSLKSSINGKPSSSGGGRRSQRSSTGSTPAVRLFRYVRVNVAKALGLLRKRQPPPSANPCSFNTVAVPQRCFVPPRDSYHSETLEDCIEFINSSYRKSI